MIIESKKGCFATGNCWIQGSVGAQPRESPLPEGKRIEGKRAALFIQPRGVSMALNDAMTTK